MANIQVKIFNEMMLKLGMNQNDRLASKSVEILELIKAKSSEILKHLNENAKTILCLDISCELLNLPFAETSMAIQQSCLKKTMYNKNRKIIQKVLDLNKKMTIDEVIRKLNIVNSNAVEKMAKEIFKLYTNKFVYEDQDIDASVFVMCVYTASKFENVKLSKKNILNLSGLTHSQLNAMEKSWEVWTCSLNKSSVNGKKEPIAAKEKISENQEDQQNHLICKRTEVTEESYDVWAKRILEKAHERLRINT